MPSRPLWALVLALPLLAASPATAAGKHSRPGLPAGISDRYGPGHVALEAQGGAGTPLGVVGVAASVDLLTQLAVEAGGGWSLDGPRGGAMVRIRRVSDKWAAGLGFGGSVGPYASSWGDVTPLYGLPTGIEKSATWHPAYWANVEGFTEWRGVSGVRIRGGLGFAWHLNRADCYGDQAACERMPVLGTFYAALAIGLGR